MSRNIRDRMSKEDLADLYHRRKTVRELAKKYNVTENYLSHRIPERAPKQPKTNKSILTKSRQMYRDAVAKEVLAGKHTIEQAAELMHVSERTAYRHLARAKKALQQEKTDGNPVQIAP